MSDEIASLPERVQDVLLAAHRATLSHPVDAEAWESLVQACERITDAEIIDLTNATWERRAQA